MWYILTIKLIGFVLGVMTMSILASGRRAKDMQREMRYRELLKRVLKWYECYINPKSDWMGVLADFPQQEIEETLKEQL
uniref:Uncharacterized protein n=1 Tax=viral metagenome TaxID=1070528 RepID=A0A6M3JZB4_9ZZZZ